MFIQQVLLLMLTFMCCLQVMDKNGHLIDLADSALSGNVRIFGEIDPEWEVDPKSIVFQEKVGSIAEFWHFLEASRLVSIQVVMVLPLVKGLFLLLPGAASFANTY